MAAVTIDDELFADYRLDLLRRVLGCSEDEALGKLVRLWRCAFQCGSAALLIEEVEALLGDRGPRALLTAGLGKLDGAAVVLRGVEKRLAAREAVLASVANAGRARAKMAVRDARGRLVSRNSDQRPSSDAPATHQRLAGEIQRHAGETPAAVQRATSDSPANRWSDAGGIPNSSGIPTSVPLVDHQRATSVPLVNIFEHREREEEEDQISLSPEQKFRAQNQTAQKSTSALDQHLPSQLPEKKRGRGRPRSGRGPLPADWSPEVAPATPWERDQLARFKDHFAANGKLMADWGAAWRNWLRRAPEFAPGFAPARVSAPAPTRTAPQAERPAMSEQERFPLNPSLQAFIEKIHAERQAAAAAEQAGEASPAAQEAS